MNESHDALKPCRHNAHLKAPKNSKDLNYKFLPKRIVVKSNHTSITNESCREEPMLVKRNSANNQEQVGIFICQTKGCIKCIAFTLNKATERNYIKIRKTTSI